MQAVLMGCSHGQWRSRLDPKYSCFVFDPGVVTLLAFGPESKSIDLFSDSARYRHINVSLMFD